MYCGCGNKNMITVVAAGLVLIRSKTSKQLPIREYDAGIGNIKAMYMYPQGNSCKQQL